MALIKSSMKAMLKGIRQKGYRSISKCLESGRCDKLLAKVL